MAGLLHALVAEGVGAAVVWGLVPTFRAGALHAPQRVGLSLLSANADLVRGASCERASRPAAARHRGGHRRVDRFREPSGDVQRGPRTHDRPERVPVPAPTVERAQQHPVVAPSPSAPHTRAEPLQERGRARRPSGTQPRVSPRILVVTPIKGRVKARPRTTKIRVRTRTTPIRARTRTTTIRARTRTTRIRAENERQQRPRREPGRRGSGPRTRGRSTPEPGSPGLRRGASVDADSGRSQDGRKPQAASRSCRRRTSTRPTLSAARASIPSAASGDGLAPPSRPRPPCREPDPSHPGPWCPLMLGHLFALR